MPQFTPDPGGPTTDPAYRYVLPVDVWTHSNLLALIRQAALARQVSPDATLHAVLAVVSSLLHHSTRLNTGKGPTPLNHYAALIGDSGAGKTEAMAVANELLRSWINERFGIVAADGYYQGPLGSGEGLVEAYMGTAMKPKLDANGSPIVGKDGVPVLEAVRAQVRHNAAFSTDEGRALLALEARQGSTVMATLCQMWSGSQVGSTNAEAGRNRKLPADSYVVGMVLGFQPGTISGLFSDEAGGAPQRFFYADTRHPDITADDITWPGGLKLDITVGELVMELPPNLRQEVREHQAAKGRGESTGGPLDGHLMLLRCRLAALLALIHCEPIGDTHWKLAGMMLDTSCALRDELASQTGRDAAEVARQQQESKIRIQVESARQIGQADETRRVADRLVAILEEHGPQTIRDAKRKLNTNQRPSADEAIKLATKDGRLETVERPGSTQGGPRRVTVLRIRDVKE